MNNLPAAVIAEVDQEIAHYAERLQVLIGHHREMTAEGKTRLEALATVLMGLNMALAKEPDAIVSILAVAVGELAEREVPDTQAHKVLNRSVTCTHGCYGGNNDFDCPIHGGMKAGGS